MINQMSFIFGDFKEQLQLKMNQLEKRLKED